MKTAKLCLLFGIFFLAGCNSAPKIVPQNMVRSYNGTASVGDFLTISINSSAQTITYKNYTNGETGTVPYTVNADGTYTISDPNGNLLSGYEVPGFVLMVEAANAGPTRDTPALITAIENAPASINTFAGQNFNYLQFRTAAGGMEMGTISIDAQGNIQHDGYWPFGVFSQNQFNGGSFAASNITEDASGDFFTLSESGGTDYIFGTQNGFFVVDTGSGTILGLPKASSKTFDASNAGTYTAIFYEKAGAQTGQGNVETGTPSESKATVTITSSGAMTITDSQGNTLATGTLAAVADTSYLYDGTTNTLSDPCYGMFTFRMTTGGAQQDVFASFQGNAVVFSSFQTALPIAGYAPYTYYYGVGLK
jgi:archaellum component FlaF (FlaF/FlaG flagellin family)